MARTFAGLAIGNFLVLLLTGGWGLFNPDASADRHVLLAVFSLLLTAFVQVLTFTYFTVTGKIIGQTVHLAGHDRGAMDTVKRLKRTFARCLAAVMGGVVVLAITGAIHWRTGGYGTVHLVLAGAFLVVCGAAMAREFGLIVENTATMDEAVRRYETWRRSAARLGARRPGEGGGGAVRGSIDTR